VSHQERSLALVLDWDGTVTERDGLHMAIERFGDLGVFDALEDELGSTLTLNEVIAAEMATIRAPLEEVRAWLVEHVRVRAGFRELVAEHDPLIVSSGFRELIEPILEREGVHARVVANRVTADADGWQQSEEHARAQRRRERDEHHRHVEPDGVEAREVSRQERRERPRQHPREPDAGPRRSRARGRPGM